MPRKLDDHCLRELRWLYDRRDLAEARADLAAQLAKWSGTYPRRERSPWRRMEDWLEAPAISTWRTCAGTSKKETLRKAA